MLVISLLLVVLDLLVVKFLLKLSPHADMSKLSITPCALTPLLCLLCPPNVGVVGGDRSLPWYGVSTDDRCRGDATGLDPGEALRVDLSLNVDDCRDRVVSIFGTSVVTLRGERGAVSVKSLAIASSLELGLSSGLSIKISGIDI